MVLTMWFMGSCGHWLCLYYATSCCALEMVIGGEASLAAKTGNRNKGCNQKMQFVDLRVSLLIHYMTCTTTPLLLLLGLAFIYQVVTETGMT